MPSGSAETHLFFSHGTIDASDTSASRTWGPSRPASPKGSIRSELRGPQRARRVPGQNDGKSIASTVCHETPQNATIWPFLLAISAEIGWAFKKEVPHGARLKSTRRRCPVLVTQTPVVPSSKTPTGGVGVTISPRFRNRRPASHPPPGRGPCDLGHQKATGVVGYRTPTGRFLKLESRIFLGSHAVEQSQTNSRKRARRRRRFAARLGGNAAWRFVRLLLL